MRVLIDKQAAIDALHEWEMVYTWDETCLEDRAKVYAPSEVIEALSAMFETLEIDQEDVPLFAGAASLLMNCREQTLKFDVGEAKKQMGEENG